MHCKTQNKQGAGPSTKDIARDCHSCSVCMPLPLLQWHDSLHTQCTLLNPTTFVQRKLAHLSGMSVYLMLQFSCPEKHKSAVGMNRISVQVHKEAITTQHLRNCLECSLCSGVQILFYKWCCRRNTQCSHHKLVKWYTSMHKSTVGGQHGLSVQSIYQLFVVHTADAYSAELDPIDSVPA